MGRRPAIPAAPAIPPHEYARAIQQRDFLIAVVNGFAQRIAGEIVARGFLPLAKGVEWVEGELLETVRRGMAQIEAANPAPAEPEPGA